MPRRAPLALLALPVALMVTACQTAADDPATDASASAGPDAPVTSPPMAGDPGNGPPPPPDDMTFPSDACGASKVASYIGKEATVPVRSAVAREAGSSADRWLYPDSMVTEDYSPTRLNVMLDKPTDRIVSMHCG